MYKQTNTICKPKCIRLFELIINCTIIMKTVQIFWGLALSGDALAGLWNVRITIKHNADSVICCCNRSKNLFNHNMWVTFLKAITHLWNLYLGLRFLITDLIPDMVYMLTNIICHCNLFLYGVFPAVLFSCQVPLMDVLMASFPPISWW